jgi:cyclopropane fatty-acyl-phospholipid synthase-like methyltransferase
MDVPSSIDFRSADTARAWSAEANTKRPWRAEFFAAIATEIAALHAPKVTVLELGSGPGFLAEVVLARVPGVHYTLLDFSPAMHDIARERLGAPADVRFVTTDFKSDGWADTLGRFDVVVTVQAVHELRHKRHAVTLHRAVRTVLEPAGVYLVCDHVAGKNGMADTELYMTAAEQAAALRSAGFVDAGTVLEQHEMLLQRARRTA